jgi:hypothetical protein
MYKKSATCIKIITNADRRIKRTSFQRKELLLLSTKRVGNIKIDMINPTGRA